MATVYLTRRSETYPHSQNILPMAAITVSAIFDSVAAKAKKGSALAASDVFQLIDIPAGALVLTVTHKVTTVEGGTCTYHIGDGTDADGFVASGNGNTTTDATSFNATTTPAFGVGKYYAADDTIDLTLATGTAAAVVVQVSVTYLMIKPNAV